MQEPPSAEPVVVQTSSQEQPAKVSSQQLSQGTGPAKAILAGSARLALAILRLGAMAYGVDHVRYKHAEGPILELDLTKPPHQQLVMQGCHQEKLQQFILVPHAARLLGLER